MEWSTSILVRRSTRHGTASAWSRICIGAPRRSGLFSTPRSQHQASPFLRNIAEPMRAWRVRLTGQAPSAVKSDLAMSQPQVLPPPDKPSIAVLPFQNMSGDPEPEYFADGMAEDIITALSRFKALFVIARNSSFTYKGRAVDVKQVG